MEPVGHEENRRPVLNFKCEKILSHIDKSSSSTAKIINKEKCKPETNEELFASPTPVKAPQLSRRSKKLEEAKLPDNFQIVGELFDGLETSVRLLRLCKKPVTFQNVCIQVEILTKRKLLYKHLAQMNYVMPEFILVESTFVHDQKSFCMLPDMKITLLPSTSGKTETFTIGPEAGDSKPLRDIFWTRLRDIILDHPEVIDIPEATLPEPFNSNSDTFTDEVSPSVRTDSTACMPSTHFASYFEQRFSNILQHHQEMEAPNLSSAAPNCVTENTSNSFMKHYSPIKQESEFEKIGSSRSAASIINPHLGQCSPVAHPPTPAQRMSKVAAQETPKGSAEIRTVLNINRRRSLKFSCENVDGSDSEQILSLNEENRERDYSTREFGKLVGPSVNKAESARIPPVFPPKDTGTASKITGHKMCGANVARHEKMLLTDLFNTICRILQSAKCPYFTKQELLHKVLFYSSETFETSEIEEKLKLMEELAPEWISQKIASTGDFLYCFCKGSDVSAVYARLAGAT
ncbi:CDT1-like protein a, chloroplastic [Nymphaea colorata]|nr:CDT1-like protein a, chloroplastic [Nymphaea colorata]